MPRRNYPPVTRRQSPFAPPSEEQIARARSMYVEKFTVSRILAACDMSLGTLYYWLDGGPLDAATGAPMLPPIPRRRLVVGKRRRALRGDQVSLVARLWRTAERQVRDIELRLAGGLLPGPERERDARMLASLGRLLRDLSAVSAGIDFGAGAAAGEGARAGPAGAAADDDPVLEDVDEFRRELARRIEAFVQERQGAPE